MRYARPDFLQPGVMECRRAPAATAAPIPVNNPRPAASLTGRARSSPPPTAPVPAEHPRESSLTATPIPASSRRKNSPAVSWTARARTWRPWTAWAQAVNLFSTKPAPPITASDLHEACCHLDGSGACSDEYPWDCELIPGESQGPGTSCAFGVCDDYTFWPCCFPMGNCEMLLIDDCMDQGGTPHQVWEDCEQANCQPTYPWGACCDNDGSCSISTEANCLAAGGYWQGAENACDETICYPREACCRPDGTCSMESVTDCINVHLGIPKAPGTTCQDVEPCPQACCLPDATCELLTPDDCLTAGGIPAGAPALPALKSTVRKLVVCPTDIVFSKHSLTARASPVPRKARESPAPWLTAATAPIHPRWISTWTAVWISPTSPCSPMTG